MVLLLLLVLLVFEKTNHVSFPFRYFFIGTIQNNLSPKRLIRVQGFRIIKTKEITEEYLYKEALM